LLAEFRSESVSRQANAVRNCRRTHCRCAGRLETTFIGQGGCRLMCAWDTQEEDVRRFVLDIKRLLVEAPKDIVVASANHRKL
jgi:selenocysteine lyase/cysteine desulfurase